MSLNENCISKILFAILLKSKTISECAQKYPSDISRQQFEQIKRLLERTRKRTKPRTVDLYEVWSAVLYLLKSSCQWRLLPKGFQNGAND